ncbi:MAG TPA: TauD/TfdA family dioxygenase [Pyrinomonadaceae bacterium]|nr:TauD/TfdA family dioxygenase [Pyrinomonadaceae bacterium]
MMNLKVEESGLKKLGTLKRRVVASSGEGLVKTELLIPGKTLPLLVQPIITGIDLADWVASRKDFLQQCLFESGAILFRNFKIRNPAEFEAVVRAASNSDLLPYRERSSPRSRIGGNVYTSTDYPSDQSIFLHNENSYQHAWPMKIFFYCGLPAQERGETPIADTRRIFMRIPADIRQRFVEKKWRYVRNFNGRFGLPWQTVFQTDEKAKVEDYCRTNRIEVEWKEGDCLKTWAVRPAVVKHPQTGVDLWFNHATFFHVSTLAPSVREVFLATIKEEDLPTNTYYGDGSPIEPETLDELRRIYDEETVAFPWQEGDILMLDNMRVAHGRAPYEGARQILVGMTEPFSRTDL